MLLLGTEPSLRWRTFTAADQRLADELGVSLVVTLGSLLADVPHTRPSPVTASATDPALLARPRAAGVALRGADRGGRRAPRRLPQAGIPSVSLWAAVPHYVSLTPSPRAAKALCDRLAELLEVPLDTSELEEESRLYMQQVSEAVASDEETAAYVDELESRADELEGEARDPFGRVARRRADAFPA